MTYNFDPDRWYENEIAHLTLLRDSGKLSAEAFERAVEKRGQRLGEMWQRLDGTYQIGGDPSDHRRMT